MTTLLRWSANFLAGALITAIAFALLDRLDALALTFSQPALLLCGVVALVVVTVLAIAIWRGICNTSGR